jgi:hypothetical protein
VVWECETRDAPALRKRLIQFLRDRHEGEVRLPKNRHAYRQSAARNRA